MDDEAEATPNKIARREEAPSSSSSSKPPKQIYEHGNYDAYYGYRYQSDGGDDPRLAAFDPSWFRGRDCLDIGCNAGRLTIAIARKFGVASMVGVDIDAKLVARAKEQIQPLRPKISNYVRSATTRCQNGRRWHGIVE